MLKIGIIDSGIGGLSVVRELYLSKVECSVIYIYDNKFQPYGNRSREALMAITFNNIERLIDENADIVVLACNTITGACVDGLRKTFSIPIIGTEPPIKPAALECDSIAVMATEYTRKSDRLKLLVDKFPGKKFYYPQCDELAMLIERKGAYSQAVREYIENSLSMIPETEAIALGCTHYYYVKPIIEQIAPYVRVYESSSGVARKISCFSSVRLGDMDLKIICTAEKIDEKTLLKYIK